MAIYKLLKEVIYDASGDLTTVTTGVKKDLGGGSVLLIPFENDNTQYQEYLEWAKTNTADAADAAPTDWDLVRRKRDQLLKNSDWTILTGTTVDQAQWSAYRDKLRAIPQTYKDVAAPLKDVVWPTVPSTKGPNTT